MQLVPCRCEEGEHNDLATLFLSSSHHTIVNLFSMGHDPGEAYVVHFTQGSLALFVVVYLVLMSVGAGVAIPGGLFMPSIMVSSSRVPAAQDGDSAAGDGMCCSDIRC